MGVGQLHDSPDRSDSAPLALQGTRQPIPIRELFSVRPPEFTHKSPFFLKLRVSVECGESP